MIIFYVLTLLIQLGAWTVDFQLTNERSQIGFQSNFKINTVSDMGGKAEMFCSTVDSVEQSCEKSTKDKSTQGGYHIENLKCVKTNCDFELVTEGQRFILEIGCDNPEELDFDTFYPWYSSLNQNCKKRRDFIVWLDRNVEYI
ncbi:hypothetical protein CONCODRAFT_4408 [Conidiobolus coronatus NRRL 28638]|uniref:Uncharacterized protein n=1 Tax=Conidiobolus coronatus (strain ATCC 28846 / CBS 209.66 / NRRL 28638) TaxID=796925 RepID=A0A137PCT4_CONC2|nr:hypothetical protein CONCODRAFT_4408 [Conidiobolus coronatus NRRL 28638]|eukprot:KXN72800.1 hypothetical protein CONCODRAFT_4408 [Conidiobolus coronatus NRRL 28638]